jgi:hypothetical protein
VVQGDTATNQPLDHDDQDGGDGDYDDEEEEDDYDDDEEEEEDAFVADACGWHLVTVTCSPAA